MRECFKVVCPQTAWIINYADFFTYSKLLVSFRKAGWKMWNSWTLPFSDLYSSVTTVRRLPVSHPAAVKLRPFSTPCRRVRVIPQRSTVKSSAPGLQAQPGWMPHKFTTHSLCYALLYPEGWEKCVALARWGRSLSTYQEKELFLKKKKKNPFGCAVRSLAALTVICNLEWGLKSSICCITAEGSPFLC